MPDTTETKILARLDTLIAMGGRLKDAQSYDPILRGQWESQSSALMEQILPPDHAYLRAWARAHTPRLASSIGTRLGMLHGLREDVAGGYLSEVRTTIVAEVFTDLLDLADHLLRLGPPSHVPAAMVAGAVLEDALRRLCAMRGVACDPKKAGINDLSAACYRDKLYLVTEHKKVAVWADVRNNADHGHFERVKEPDVKDMLAGVRRFIGDHLK